MKRSFFNKLQKRIHTLIWIRQQNIFAFHLLHHADPFGKRSGRLRCKRLVDQRFSHRFGNLICDCENKPKLHRHFRPENTFRRNLKPVAEIFFHLFSERSGCLKSYNCHFTSFMKCFFHNITEIFIICQRFIIRCDIRIPRYANIVFVRYLILFKNKFQIFHDHFFHSDVAHIMPRKIENVRNVLWHRHNAEHDIIFHFQRRHDVNIFIKQMRERMVRIYDLRRYFFTYFFSCCSNSLKSNPHTPYG